MKRLIATLLVCIAAVFIYVSPVPRPSLPAGNPVEDPDQGPPVVKIQDVQFDQEFVSIAVAHQVLNNLSAEYNKQCANIAPTDACEKLRAGIVEKNKDFIFQAVKYHDSRGDCKAELRNRVVMSFIKIAMYNNHCSGWVDPDQVAPCKDANEEIEAEAKQIDIDIDKCIKDAEKQL
jgi:hypothetical protein